MEHLSDGQLAFTLDRSAAGGPVQSWVWVPETGQVVLNGERTTFLTRSKTPEQIAVRDAFHEDAWWLNPAIHVLWAQAPTTIEDGVLTYPDGDVHRFEADGAGLIGRVRYESTGTDGLVATFSDYRAVGPLMLAQTRTLSRGGEEHPIELRGLRWTTGGTSVTVTRDGSPFLTVFPDHCRLGDARVTRRIFPEASYGPGWTESDTMPDASLWVRPVDGTPVEGRYSTKTLQLQSTTWLRESGVLGCDFHVLEVETLREIVNSATDAERSAILAILLAWHLDETRQTVLSSLVVERIRKSARDCAGSGACDKLYALLDRDRPDADEGGG